MKASTFGKICAVSAMAAGAVLVSEYFSYRFIFYSPRGGQNDDHRLMVALKNKEEREKSIAMIDALNEKPFERVEITSFDGLQLRGRYYHIADGAPLAILCHGYRGTPSRDFCGGADICFNEGMNVLLIEERAHCSSEGHTITFGVKERLDVLAWTRWAVRRFGPEVKILLAGISMGASAVLMASELALPENVCGILADCPFSSPWDIIKKVGDARGFNMDIWRPFIKMEARIYGDFELDAAEPVTAVKHANVPILLIHGEDDRFVPCEMSRQIAEANPEMIEFHTFPGAGHGVSYLADTERYTKLVRDFCEKIFS